MPTPKESYGAIEYFEIDSKEDTSNTSTFHHKQVSQFQFWDIEKLKEIHAQNSRIKRMLKLLQVVVEMVPPSSHVSSIFGTGDKC